MRGRRQDRRAVEIGAALAALLRRRALRAGRAVRAAGLARAGQASELARRSWAAANARRRAIAAVALIGALSAGAGASARFEPESDPMTIIGGPDLAAANAYGGPPAPRPGQVASANLAEGGSGAGSFGGAPGRPCTPRRLAIQALGSEEEGTEIAAEEEVAPPEAAPVEYAAGPMSAPSDFYAFPSGFGGPGGGSGGPQSVPAVPGPGGPSGPPGNFVPPPAAVPEPATWATMILGFGAIGAMLRRRARIANA